jgi:HSP20 family protein
MNNLTRQPTRNIGWGLFNDDLDNVFEGFFRPFHEAEESASSSLMPAIDLHENDHDYVVRAEIPGVKKEDIDITVHDGVLSINAESKYQHEDKQGGRVIRQERRYGKYVRSLRLGKNIDESKVKASYKDGVLELVLPKVEEVKPKKISVDIED